MPRAIDLFCGCGGLSLGFQNAGFQIVHAFDNWDKAVNIYNTNFKDHEAEILDVYNLTTGYLNTFRPDVIIGDHHAKTIHLQDSRMKREVGLT